MGYDFDLVVVGSGPAGQKAAIQAAKLGRRAAVIDRGHMIGGVCINTGTIPSKTLREAVIYLTGMNQRGIYGQSYRVKSEITAHDLFWRMTHVIGREVDVVRNQLGRNHVQVVSGAGRFLDPHTIGVLGEDGEERRLTASRILIAVGTRPARPASVEFDGRTILDSDDILNLDYIPASLLVVGAGVIGIEYASMFAALGTKVTVVEQRSRLLEFCDSQVIEALQYHLRDTGVVFRFGEKVAAAEKHKGGAIVHLASGKRVPAEAVLYSAGRQGATDELELENAGLEADPRGRIAVNAAYRTKVRHIYAAGDVIGFPSLAASSMEQGRLAACDAFGVKVRSSADPMPIGIYTIPEISYVGKTEEELTAAAIPYEIGDLALPRAGPRPDRRRLARDAQAARLLGRQHAARRARVRHRRDGARPHRPDADVDRRHDRPPGRRRVQLPDARRVVQGGGAGRDEPRPRHPPPRRLAAAAGMVPGTVPGAVPGTDGRRGTQGTRLRSPLVPARCQRCTAPARIMPRAARERCRGARAVTNRRANRTGPA